MLWNFPTKVPVRNRDSDAVSGSGTPFHGPVLFSPCARHVTVAWCLETVQKLGVLWTGPVAENRGRDEGRVLMKMAGADDTVEVHEVGIGERP